MDVWTRMATKAEADYGCHINWRDGFFICPECGEPIYQTDWQSEDLITNDRKEFACPICESII